MNILKRVDHTLLVLFKWNSRKFVELLIIIQFNLSIITKYILIFWAE